MHSYLLIKVVPLRHLLDNMFRLKLEMSKAKCQYMSSNSLTSQCGLDSPQLTPMKIPHQHLREPSLACTSFVIPEMCPFSLWSLGEYTICESFAFLLLFIF